MARKQAGTNGDHVTAPAEPEPAIEPPRHESEDRGNFPSHVVRFGLVRACIWQVQTDQGTRHNVTVSRLYKGGDDAWHSSNVFSYRDLLPLAKALDWAHTYIAEQIACSDVPF
jgi:hypothetical protein